MVELNENGISAACLDLAAHSGALVFVATIGDRHVHPLGGERSGDYGAKAAGSTRDQRNAISQVHWLSSSLMWSLEILIACYAA
jgi:hypothetical protein